MTKQQFIEETAFLFLNEKRKQLGMPCAKMFYGILVHGMEEKGISTICSGLSEILKENYRFNKEECGYVGESVSEQEIRACVVASIYKFHLTHLKRKPDK